MPVNELLIEYNLKEYTQLSIAIRKGDQYKFKLEIEKYMKVLIKRGLYLIMERF
jgi:hypothetical protein